MCFQSNNHIATDWSIKYIQSTGNFVLKKSQITLYQDWYGWDEFLTVILPPFVQFAILITYVSNSSDVGGSGCVAQVP